MSVITSRLRVWCSLYILSPFHFAMSYSLPLFSLLCKLLLWHWHFSFLPLTETAYTAALRVEHTGSMPRKNRSIVAVETNPLEHVDFRVIDGTLKSLKVFAGCIEDVGKLFVQCDLCGTFISLGARRSPKNMETHRDKTKCKEQNKKKERELTKTTTKLHEQATLRNLFNEPGGTSSILESECQ